MVGRRGGRVLGGERVLCARKGARATSFHLCSYVAVRAAARRRSLRARARGAHGFGLGRPAHGPGARSRAPPAPRTHCSKLGECCVLPAVLLPGAAIRLRRAVRAGLNPAAPSPGTHRRTAVDIFCLLSRRRFFYRPRKKISFAKTENKVPSFIRCLFADFPFLLDTDTKSLSSR